MKRKTTEEFIIEAEIIHKKKYDYSKVQYKNFETKICIICPEHGEFWQTPNNHLKGNGCPICGKILQNNLHRKNTIKFIAEAQKIHGDKYDYSKVEYKGALQKVCIICPEHGEFWQIPNSHLNGSGCKKCVGMGLTTEEWIEKANKIHNYKYDYSKTNYVGHSKKVCIICPEHGEFWQLPSNHLQGTGCPNCRNYKLELEIKNFLTEQNIVFEQHKNFKWLKNKKSYKTVDFYLPHYSIVIECQGIQHFVPTDFANKGLEWAKEKLDKTIQSDNLKRKLCEEHNIHRLYFSNLDIEYPYEVFTNKNNLLEKIKSYGTNIVC